MHPYFAYTIISLFAYLIINWGFNVCRGGTREGIEGGGGGVKKSDPQTASKTSAPASSSSGSKCPEDCTSVKELQQKLSDATKKVATLEEEIVANTKASVQHSAAIANLTQSINDMQKKQEDN